LKNRDESSRTYCSLR